MFNKRELKIFFTFFIIYSFFVYWSSWNEESRFALTRALTEEQRFEIDSFVNQTGDRSYYNGHYYSDKSPGLSFLAAPIHALWKFVYYNIFPKDFILRNSGTNEFVTEIAGPEVFIIHYTNPDLFVLLSNFFVTIFTSSLFSALTVLLIYKILKYFSKEETNRLLTSFVAGLGTLIFSNALTFRDFGMVTFFLFLSFYLLFKEKKEKVHEKKNFIISGLLLGMAITIASFIVLIFPFYLLYLLSFDKKKIKYLIFGIVVGVLSNYIYSFATSNTFRTIVLNLNSIRTLNLNSFRTIARDVDPTIWRRETLSKRDWITGFFVMGRLILYPERGLFFYFPILLLSLPGLYYMIKKYKTEAILITSIFLAFLIANSFFVFSWWGGPSFGSRYLIPTIPFLILPLAYFYEKFNKMKIIKLLFFFLAILSIFYNFAGLRHVPDEFINIENRLQVRPEYREKIATFEVITNPLYEYYIPSLLRDGPRSKFFESLFKPPINICMPPACGSTENLEVRQITLFSVYPIGTFILNLPFLCLVPLLLIIFLLWSKDLFEKKEIKNWLNRRRVVLFSLLILLIFFLLFINIE